MTLPIDVSRCEGENCPLRDYCMRYEFDGDNDWYWFVKTPYRSDQDSCEYFWPVGVPANLED